MNKNFVSPYGLKVLTIVAMLCAMTMVILSCDSSIRYGVSEIIGVEEHHATRVYLIYLSANDIAYRQSTHQSKVVIDSTGLAIRPRNYLNHYNGAFPYGPVSGREDKYKKYVNNEYLAKYR